MSTIILQNSTGNQQIDDILCDVISLCETTFPGQVKAYYLFGSYADGSGRMTSDIDFCLVPRDRFVAEAYKKVQHIRDTCALSYPIMVDMIVLDEPLLLKEGHFRIKSASSFLWGEDLRANMPEQTFDYYVRKYTNAPLSYMLQVLRHIDTATFPLSYPDPTAEFYGYDQPYFPPRNGARRNIKGLVSSVCWAASILIAWQAGKTVEAKSASVKMYRDLIHDAWTPFLEEMYEYGSKKWAYLVPNGEEDRLRLRHLCARTLAFENHYLGLYRDYLLQQLQTSDCNATLVAAKQLQIIAYPDQKIVDALHSIHYEHDSEMRQAVTQALHAIADSCA
ncbi:nucleotidyltransferase domain-containing protein [Dictyobacter formicarum]|uniref:Polymerase beta nucleotidyltransferase domain-containing protein n=1 Tax=Dictyobacter formicarum TaxID=2778368 RepID=A0ABQ3VUZ2_9CHLR|nr:nucleotidyltransferase domain-containing protein [Dictyobacter formicarum]GHO89208.1 hypothetical protein KSZ_72140 [Dictyobacter formicarum]